MLSVANTRQFQEESDLHRLYLALEYHRRSLIEGWAEPSDAPWTLGKEAASLQVDELKKVVNGDIIGQLRILFSNMSGIHLHECTNQVPQRDFNLVIRASQVAGAGDGVWLDGKASVGQVVALFPGLIYRKDEVKMIPGYPNFGVESDFLMSRYDGCIFDSRAWTSFCNGKMHEYSAQCKHNAKTSSLLDHQFSAESKQNQLALGHMVNHPPKGFSPNVMGAPVDWSLMPTEKDWDKILPWKKFCEKENDGVIRGLALVAMRTLETEELFVNYRLNPDVLGGLPKWYHPVDDEEDLRRWC